MIINIPNNATNGDVIKALFPDCLILDKGESFCSFWYTKEDEGRYVNFINQWWNAPYKENENKEKTITKKEAIQCKPEFFNPEQEGEEKYNQGWNDAIHHFINNIREFGEYDNIIQCDRE